MSRLAPPFNLYEWIAHNRALLQPPVGNKLLFENSSIIVMAVGGPNSRKDFHHDPGEEVFFQIEGNILLKTVQDGHIIDIPIRQGEMFLLPAEIAHSPQRPAGTIGIVIERRRSVSELDGFSWYCDHCGHELYMERVAVNDLEGQLPEILSRFYNDPARCTCSVCGTIMRVPAA